MSTPSLMPVHAAPRQIVNRRSISPALNELPEYITRDEARAIIGAAETERDHLLLELLWQSGARVSEAVALRVADIQPPMQLRLPNRKQRRLTEKTVYVAEGLVAALAMYALTKRLRPEERIFPITTRRAEQIVQASAQKARVFKLWNRHGASPQVRPAWAHLFRHGAGVHLMRETGRLDMVQDQLGHADLNTTKQYLRVTNAEKQALIKGVQF